MTDGEFYDRCATLLGAAHEHLPFTGHQRNRWNNRRPGSGRFPGCGVIRLFGDHVHISLRNPVALTRVVEGRQEALDALARAVGEGRDD